MAVAEYYVPAPLVHYRSRIGFSVRQYFQGTSVPSYVAFGALAAVFFVAIFARQIAPYDPLAAVGQPMTAPNAANLLGTDTVGRDILSRVLAAVQTSWFGALAVVAFGVVFGGLIGLIAGACGGWFDAVLMRVTDAFLALPGPILALAVVAALGRSYIHTLIGVAIVWWPLYTRIVRAEVRRLRASPHMEAATDNPHTAHFDDVTLMRYSTTSTERRLQPITRCQGFVLRRASAMPIANSRESRAGLLCTVGVR